LAEQKRFAFSYNKKRRKKEKRNEINKRRETRKRREFESLYLVCYDEEDKYDDWGSPELLKCFSGIEGRILLLNVSTLYSENDSVKSCQKYYSI